jgi:hypothetical protein
MRTQREARLDQAAAEGMDDVRRHAHRKLWFRKMHAKVNEQRDGTFRAQVAIGEYAVEATGRDELKALGEAFVKLGFVVSGA